MRSEVNKENEKDKDKIWESEKEGRQKRWRSWEYIGECWEERKDENYKEVRPEIKTLKTGRTVEVIR